MAERVGFEPTVGLHLRRISSAVHSTTLPPLRIQGHRPSLATVSGRLGRGSLGGVFLLIGFGIRKPFIVVYGIFIPRFLGGIAFLPPNKA